MWSVSNYEGQYAFGQSGVLTNAMFELCRAVNERQHALDVVVTEFKDKDGNLGSDLELEDFVGMFITGENNHFGYNCTQIANWIRLAVAAGWFMEQPSATSVQWTPESMETDIGLGSSWLTGLSTFSPSNPCDYVFYQRCKEALDRMTYVAARNRYDTTQPMSIVGSESDTGYATLADAWANRGDFPYASPATSDGTLRISLDYIFAPSVLATTNTSKTIPYKKDKYILGASVSGIGNNTLTGTISEMYAAVSRTRTSEGPPGYNVSFGNFVVDGDGVPYPITTLPLSPLGTDIFSRPRLHEITSASLASDFDLLAELGEPFSFSSGAVFEDLVTVQFVEIYVDISSELSDQT